MEDQNIHEEEQNELEEKEVYQPRPAYQVWAARIGVTIVIVAFLLYCLQIAAGGL